MLGTKIRATIAAAALAACALTTTLTFAEDSQVAQSAPEHEARAKAYRERAAEYRKDAADHKKMAEVYAKTHADMKGGVKNPWNEKMQKHCMALVKDYEKLAADADMAAVYHEQRAKEGATK